ncbi:MAG: 50S ribosomal protein L25, partial [Verrucomicrobia bacterium]|nr:50S ribosomal protein L25 [Verrucomicrobiota bacterium]
SLQRHELEGRLLEVDVDGESKGRYVLKDVQLHPVSGNALHVDFTQISMEKTMRSITHVACHGTPVGLELGGVLEHLLREVEIECLPMALIDTLHIDISGLNIGDTILVGDIPLPEGIVVLTAPDIAVVSVLAPRVRTDTEVAEDLAAESAENDAPAGKAPAGKAPAGKAPAGKAAPGKGTAG